MRIHITGNAGAGKSTAAVRVGAMLDLPVFHLDGIVWQSGWKKTPPAERADLEAALIAKEHWVIEGVSATVRQAADHVVMIDQPRRTCYYRAFKRNLPYYFTRQSRPGLPEHCPEIAILPTLIRIIHRFPDGPGAQIREEARTRPHYTLVRNNRELDAWLQNVC